MAGVVYDKQLLHDMRRSLQGLRLGAHLPRLAQLIAVGGVKLTMDTFRNQRDPYGRAWRPLAKERARDRRARLRALAKGKKPRGQKILIDTARMRNSTAPIHMGRSGGVGIPTGYAAVHQNGATIHPHSRLASYANVTYRVAGRFASMRTAERAHRAGQRVEEHRYRRTYAEAFRIPQRMMLPDRAMGLPAHWQRMIQREGVALMTRWLQKGARA